MLILPESIKTLINAFMAIFAKKEDVKQSDWSAPEGEPGHVLNRTHYESTETVNEPLSLEFTSMDGLEKIVWLEDDADWGSFYKLSDAVMTAEQVKDVVWGVKGNPYGDDLEYRVGDEWDVVEDEGTEYEFPWVEKYDNAIVNGNRYLFFIFEDNVTLYKGEEFEITFPTKGIYAQYDWTFRGQATFYLTAPIATTTKTVVHKLDKKYLPDDVALPTYSAEDEGKILRIVNGVPTWVSLPNAEEASF